MGVPQAVEVSSAVGEGLHGPDVREEVQVRDVLFPEPGTDDPWIPILANGLISIVGFAILGRRAV